MLQNNRFLDFIMGIYYITMIIGFIAILVDVILGIVRLVKFFRNYNEPKA